MAQKIFFISNIKNSLVRVVKHHDKKFLGLAKINIENYLFPYRLLSTSIN
ncbi:tRNA pseudouridine(55) synthase TruB [Buchnera aphidicola]|nr:tRNA pseudouridine(55) synthase TruB [Buchnera aphidicola]